MTRVLIADDHPIVLEGLAALLAGAGHEVVARCRTGDEVPAALERCRPELLLLDLHMPGEDGLQLLRRFAAMTPPWTPRVVLLTSSVTDAQAAEALRLGVGGVALKETPPEQLLECIRQVAAGQRWVDRELGRRAMEAMGRGEGKKHQDALTPREAEVAELVLQGLRNRQIGERLGITEGTVKIYLHTIYQKLGISARLELAGRLRGST